MAEQSVSFLQYCSFVLLARQQVQYLRHRFCLLNLQESIPGYKTTKVVKQQGTGSDIVEARDTGLLHTNNGFVTILMNSLISSIHTAIFVILV